MKKCLILLFSLIMLISLCSCAEMPVDDTNQKTVQPDDFDNVPERDDVYVLYTNDVHCAVDSGIGYNGVSAAKRILELANQNVLLVDCGDAIQGGLVGTLTEGEAVINIMNGLGYDVATFGNHEFDYGVDRFFELAEIANYPYLSANFTDSDGNLLFDAYRIIEKGGWKIAFVGVSTPKTISTSTPSHFMNENGEYAYSFCQDETGEKLYNAVQLAVDSARAEGADFVVALAHLGISADSSPWTSGELVTNTTDIDVLLDAHSHSLIECDTVKNADGKQVIVSSAGTMLQALGCLKISSDGTLSTVLLDDGTSLLLSDVMDGVDEINNAVVARTDVNLCISDPETGIRMVRQAETNLGDLCADAYRAAFGADIALVNAGNVRADISKGDITYGDLISVSPFGNEICMIEATGQEILDALELDVSDLPGERGGFPQVSGISFTVDLNIPSGVVLDVNGMFVSIEGERRIRDCFVGDKPIDTEKTYTLVSNAYIIKESGDGVNMFADNALISEGGKLDNQVLIEYIVDYLGGTVGEQYKDPYGEGRIIIIPAE